MYYTGSPTLYARLLKYVQVGGMFECWPWTGHTDHKGYGRIRLGGRGTPIVAAHRVMYEYMIGEIPDGTQLDHECENTLCCNVLAHVRPISPALNNHYRNHGRMPVLYTEQEVEDLDRMLMEADVA